MREFSIARLQYMVIALAHLGKACHILPLTQEAFGGNFLHLLHAIAVYEGSGGGAFMVDHTMFPYRCDDTGKGGFSDFWNHTGVIPWSKDTEERYKKRTGDACKRLDFLAVDHQVALLGATWDELDSIALRRVGCRTSFSSPYKDTSCIEGSKHLGVQ